MTKGSSTFGSTVVASAIGIIGAIVTNYFITQDTIDAKFKDWQARLEISSREDERRSQVSQLTQAQKAFHLHINHIRIYHQIAFDFHLNEAIATHQPAFAFRNLSDSQQRKMISSLIDNIDQAHSKKFQMDRDMAESDAGYKSSLETLLYRHNEDCVVALSKIPNMIELEINEAEAYFAELSPYIQSQSQAVASRSEFMSTLTSSQKHLAAFDFDKPVSEFSAATELCHGVLEAGFTSSNGG